MSDASIDELNAAFERLIPRAAQMGVRFTDVRPGSASAHVPFEGNGNHFGAIYAGVIFTVAEVLGGAIAFGTFGAATHYPVLRGMTIDFRAPAMGPLVASAALSTEQIGALAETIAEGGKAPFVLEAEVRAEDGTVVATTHGDYQLRPYAT
ncbi:MAG TPA: YiiD C-terminal domain-containing protein [Jatrophihabitantaceae bacterium]|nr:YiiD C-terminal domain-containing protein [Jatrophihabitantaceae bacterium]